MIDSESERYGIVEEFDEEVLRLITSNPKILRTILLRSFGPTQLKTLGILAKNPNSPVPMQDIAAIHAISAKNPGIQASKTLSELRMLGFKIERNGPNVIFKTDQVEESPKAPIISEPSA